MQSRVKGYFITFEEPTADQRGAVNRFGGDLVHALSYSQFRALMIDAPAYLELRKRYQFGSMFDPDTHSRTEPTHLIAPNLATPSGETLGVKDIVPRLEAGETFVLVGDYGAGKSTTLREVFVELGSRYSVNKSGRFPVHLNLRDHHGQTDPAEALDRHAKKVGFPSAHHLVRAWNAGYVTLLLDGFDEFAIAGWSGQPKRLRETRYKSMELIRKFVRESSGGGIMIAGRQHYFDSNRELASALGLDQDCTRLDLSNFTDDQIREFLSKKGWASGIPAWLPSRPLLLGYLCSRDILEEVMTVDSGSSPAAGWDDLLERTANREAEIEAGIDGPTVRQLVENLATKARSRNDGISSLYPEDILRSFQSVCGFTPDDKGVLLLQRLPGLGATSAEDGSRDFIDTDLADAARAGDIFRFVEDPFSFQLASPANWQMILGQLGRELAARRCYQSGFNQGKLRTALQQAGKDNEQGALCMDIVQVSKEMGHGYLGPPQTIRNILVQEASFGDTSLDFSNVSFRDCLFQRLELDIEAETPLLPKFYGCYFGTLDGRVSQMDLPKGWASKFWVGG